MSGPYVASSIPVSAPVNGNGQCVTLVKALTGAPASSLWHEGAAITPLSAASLLPGTAIATFVNGHYPNAPHGNHAAIFVGAVKDGIKVLDQWVGHAPIQRVIKFNHAPNAGVAQCPEKYSVVL
jgi:hypothetical protein